ncbi:MAG TPA: glycosyltransferase family A protein [Candidatus Sumerlaeota bacterium]|nr:glycosyltransferase family A protein [Candidatus Sumerlaeota bacterium]HPS01191.1 glycosyltransferase family A protein [Candidatus Sumerlaeota bacterium]
MGKYRYVLITPARNEEQYIETTLKAVVQQEQQPEKWVIVSDGSTDRTDKIVQGYAEKYPFIHLLRREPDSSRDFGSKVFAIRAGVSLLADVEYDFIGNLDADISFQPDYFLRILERFDQIPQLGLAGGDICELNQGEWEARNQGKWDPRKIGYDWEVAGAVQLFRHEVFESIGGYLPLSYGGEDTIAGVMVRMKGWETRTFSDIRVCHHRTMGTLEVHSQKADFRRGIMEYANGYHPLFQAARLISGMRFSPRAHLSRTAGYLYAMLKRVERVVPPDVVKYMYQEHMQRLGNSLPWRKK